jgi:hypothetical protein
VKYLGSTLGVLKVAASSLLLLCRAQQASHCRIPKWRGIKGGVGLCPYILLTFVAELLPQPNVLLAYVDKPIVALVGVFPTCVLYRV